MSERNDAPRKRPTRAEELQRAQLDELFGPEAVSRIAAPVEAISSGGAPTSDLSGWYDIELVDDNPVQIRGRISGPRLARLVKSINENGQVEAARARPHPKRRGRVQLVGGHRRKMAIRAGANAGIKMPDPQLYIGKIRLDVSPMKDEDMLDAGWVENEDREDFSVFDRARYYVALRKVESKKALPERSAPGQNALPKNLGAAQTADGLLSWEALVSLRRKEGKAIPGADILRRLARVVELEPLEEQLSEINLVSDVEAENGNFEGISEKHCRALLLLPTKPARMALIARIEKQRLSANETLKIAQAEQPKPKKEPKNSKSDSTSSQSSSNSSSGEQSAPPVEESVPSSEVTGSQHAASSGAPAIVKDDDPTPQDPWRSNLPAQKAGENGVGESAPFSSGSGFATAPDTPQSNTAQSGVTPFTTRENTSGDIVSTLLEPATRNIADAARLLPQMQVGSEYKLRVRDSLTGLKAELQTLEEAAQD